VVAGDDAMFESRTAAAELLVADLASYRGKHALVLAIPRGAVPMGEVIATRLDGELDVVLVRKLRAPGNPELAIGAIDESGWVYVAPHAASVGADHAYLEEERRTQQAILRERRARYTPGRGPIDPSGRIVIVVDDGLATGATMIAALHSARAKGAAQLSCAIPVASYDGLQRVQAYADQVVCLAAPKSFYAVGQFYREFRQVEDDEVIALLAQRTRAGARKT
jgi:putative phosphoribosyl transferase